MKFGYIGAAYESESLNLNAQQSINLYLEKDESTGKPALLGTPGLVEFAELPETPIRGLLAGEDRLFAAAGDKLYEVFSDGTYDELGEIADDASHSPVQIFPNGQQLMIVSAGRVYADNGGGPELALYSYTDENGDIELFQYVDLEIDVADNTKLITDPIAPFAAGDVGKYLYITEGLGFTTPQLLRIIAVSDNVATMSGSLGSLGGSGGVAFEAVMGRTGALIDGYGVIHPPETKRFQFSENLDFTTWLADEFSTKEAYPDNICSLLADHTELWITGTHRSTEVWRNEGDVDMAGGFRRDPSAHLHLANAATYSLVNLEGPAWLAGDTRGRISAVRMRGFSPERISTHAIENIWSSYSTVADAIGWTQLDKGHLFWWLTFPTADATWVYDLMTQTWHQRSYYSGGVHHRHRARCHAFAFGKHLVGDHTTGQIFELSRSVYTDDGAAIRRVRSAPHISEELKRIFYSRLELECEVTTGQAPDMLLEWSDDGGHNFTSPITIQADRASRKGRIIANRLGSTDRPRVFRTTFTDAVRIAIQDAHLEATLGGR